jgi:PAS domain S-box-containing protein
MPSPWVAVDAGTDLLARARQLQSSWDRLLGEGALGPELPPQAMAGMRPMIVDSWRRVLATGLEPIDVLPSIEADPSETRERWLEHPLGLLRHVLVEPLQLLAEESNSVVQVTDPSGLTLYLGGPEWLKARAAEMNLVEGARCSETVNGTNGVGTALATDRPVQVFGFEHFSHHHREWVCSGAPIHDRVSGRLVGVIDLSSPWKIAHPRSLELVTSSAKTTEQCLLEGRRDHDARLRRRYGDLTTKTSDLLVNREGYVLIGDDLAHPKPLDIPENGGEIATGDGSLAVAEPVGRGEAYLVRRPGPRRARAARGEALERVDERARELAEKRAAPSHACDPQRAGVESGLPSPRAGEHLSAYLEAAIDCVIVADASGRIVEFNPAAELTFGYSRHEALGRTMAELIVPPSLRERHTAAFAHFVKTRQGSMLGRRVELTGMRADGSEFPVELALSQVETEPLLICGALRDISATKQAESHLRELAEEQAALRQVATLVAYESSPDRLVAVVVEQVARVFDVPLVRLIRYEPTAAVVLGGFSESDDEPFPIGSRWQLDTPGLLATIRHTGRAARVEDYAQTPGDGAGVVGAAGMRSAVGSPIVVGGRVWGAIVLLSPRRASLPEDTGARLADFTELVATALANAESRAALSQLADEQAALRRVATLVASEASPVELLETVAEEVARVLDVEAVGMLRFEPDGTATLVAQSDTPWDPPPLGTRLTLEGENVVTAVFRTREAARLDDWAKATGPVAEMARVLGIRSSVATPIVAQGRLWGTLIAVTSQSEPLPRETDSRIGEFTELVATAIANAQARYELSRLVEEQAALRRVATLVAEGPAPTEVFDAVVAEVGQLLGAAQIGLARYENEHEISVLAIRGQSPEIVRTGVRLPLDGDSVNARILRTGRSARLNFAEAGSGSIAEVLRRDNVNATVGAPIVVDGALWGMIGASWRGDDQPPANAEKRVEKFTELVATAIANTESRAELAASEARARALAGEQAALRRVAILVAKGASSDELFAAVTREAADVLDVPVVALQRYEADRMFTMVAIAGETTFTVGSRWPVEDEGLAGMILASGRPARRQEYTTMPGPLGAALRAGGMVSAVGVPIVVEGSIWGFMTAGARPGKPTPDGTEERLARFTDLVATAIADSQAREQLAQLASEQAALRRVATMVAQEPPPAEVFAAFARAPASEQLFSIVAREVASVLDVPGVIVTRYEPDGTAVTVGEAFGPDLASVEQFLGIGTPMPPDPGTLTALVLDTHEPARVDDLSTSPGTVGEVARAAELGSGCAGPIVVNGAVWGKMCVFSRLGTVLPAGTENRLRDFIDLIATAIANYEARAELAASEARAGELADEQAALRRVATLVARGVSPDEMFSAVTNEMAQLFGSPQACVGRFQPDGSAMVVVGVSDGTRGIPIGSRWELEDYMASTGVYRTGRPVRVEQSDLEHVSGPMADVLREIGAVSNVGAPIVVEGRQWGFVTVSDVNKRLPPDAEKRLEKFAELLGTAIANADSRAELAGSRARIIAAGDDARRRIERDLHDGAQQRLVTLTAALRRADAKLPPGADELRADLTRVAEGLTTAVDELRELSRGIHPSILTEGGLSPALKALGRRSPVRVKLDMGFEQRLPDHVEVAAYYTVSEALTNASKHANATRVWVSLRVDHDMLRLSIRDDGVGGADSNRGSGLTGLRDRIEALGGQLKIESPSGSGTLIEVEIPTGGPADRNDEPDELLSQATTPGSPR